ncbi:MAG TPA: AMP-binding protein, partial [Acidimicrobiia bacterium]
MPDGQLNLARHFLFDRLAAGSGARAAIHTDDEVLDYDAVAALTAGFGERMRAAGVHPEQRVVISLPDGPDMACAILGAIAIGAVAVMVSPELRPEQLNSILSAASSPLLVVDPAQVDSFRLAAVGSEQMLVMGDRSWPRPGPVAAFEIHDSSRDDIAAWLFSGGTTGAPKIVPQSHRSFVNTTERYAQATLGLQANDITIAVPRLYFGYATGAALFFPFSVGASTVLFPDKPTPTVLFDQIRRHRPTIFITAPSAIAAMLSEPFPEADLSSIRLATSAGEALPEALYHRWVERFGVELLDGLGTAE